MGAYSLYSNSTGVEKLLSATVHIISSVTPDIHIAYKWNGKCYVGVARLWKEYVGGGKYDVLKVGWWTCNLCGDPIECELIK